MFRICALAHCALRLAFCCATRRHSLRRHDRSVLQNVSIVGFADSDPQTVLDPQFANCGSMRVVYATGRFVAYAVLGATFFGRHTIASEIMV